MVDLSKIDTQEKAYLLGILGADGCMKQRGKYYCLSFGLTYSDREHVQRVAQIISDKIKTHDYSYKGRKNKMTYFEIGNRQLCLDLISRGIVPRKSSNLKPPVLPKTLVSHYVRGYFDGDGSVFFQGSRVYANCVGAIDIMEFINYNFQEFYPNRANVTWSGNGSLYHLKLSGKTAIAFLNYIYRGATIYLDRKYNKALPHLVSQDCFLSYMKGLKRLDVWLSEEEEFLKDNAGVMAWKDIASHLGRGHKAVTEKAYRMGLTNSHVRFTREEVAYVVENYSKKTRGDVAAYLAKSLRALLQEVRLLKEEGRWDEPNGYQDVL
jgi:hypothetical protein